MVMPHPRPLTSFPHARFAFLVHPRNELALDVTEGMPRVLRPITRRIPDNFYERAFAQLPLKPWVQNKIVPDGSDNILGECIVVPLSPKQLLGRDRKLVNQRIDDAIDLAKSRGATIIGLGALTATATVGGKKLANRDDIGVTNGNAFTAAATVTAIKNVVAGFEHKPVVALVGATGSVGAAVSQTLAVENIAEHILLIGRTPKKLIELAASMQSHSVSYSLDIADCNMADVIVLMTSATEALLGTEHLKKGAIVIDDTQPRNTTPELLTARPDVLLIDGGIVHTPGLKRIGASIGIPAHVSFACLAETALLALKQHVGHGVIGNPTLDQVSMMQRLAHEFAHLGFHLAPPTCFGKPIHVPGWSTTVEALS